MIGAMNVCTMYTVHTTNKIYDTWDAGRVGKVSGIEVTGTVLGMPDLNARLKTTFWAPEMHIMPKTINHEKHCLKIVYSDNRGR